MQQLRTTRSLTSAFALACTGALLFPQHAHAQAASADQDGPIILIAERRTSAAAGKKDPLNSGMRGTLNTVFSNSGKFQLVYTFTPFMPVLNQAVRNHLLQASDLEEPLKPASVHKIAKVLGATTILLFHSVQEKADIHTEVLIEESAGVDSWRSVVSNQFRTPLTVAHKKLTLDEIVGVNVDAIARAMKVPSHLVEDMHLEVALPPIQPMVAKSTKPDTKSTPKDNVVSTPPPTSSTGEAAVADPPAAVATTPTDTQPAQSTKVPKPDKAKPTRAVAVPPTTSGSTGTPTTVQKQPKKQPDPVITPLPTPENNLPPDGAQAFSLDTQRTVVAETISNAARAARYRVSGDLPSAILYFRRAIDDNPNDIETRKLLIQAYQDFNAPDLAEAELTRTLKLGTPSAGLYRMVGAAQYSNGHIPEAAAAYQSALELAPHDAGIRLAYGDMLLGTGDSAGAAKQFALAAADAPNSPEPHRRLAKAALQKASSDAAQYAACLDEIKKTRALIAPSEIKSYLADYYALMKIMESRLTDILDQVDSVQVSFLKGTADGNACVRLAVDMNERAQAASDFLDALPAAAGQDGVHALYQEGAASVLASISYLKSLAKSHDQQYDTKLRSEKTSARHDITEAGKRLQSAKAAIESK
jgi:tetratricopeptide (TPR) repeat protein